MITIYEYLLSKSKTSDSWKATDENIHELVREALDERGLDADLNYIDVSAVTDMTDLFAAEMKTNSHKNALGEEYADLNPDISKWDVRNVKSFDHMFWMADKFDCDLSSWNVSSAVTMNYMFCHAHSFNSDLSKWDVSNVAKMQGMFSNAYKFNSDISNWDVHNVTTMQFMFYEARSFNQDLRSWAPKRACDGSSMFKNCPIEPKNHPHNIHYY